MSTRIYPKDPYREILKANTGLDYYTVDGEVTEDVIETPDGNKKIWLFAFSDLREPEARAQMIKIVMSNQKVSEREAINFLNGCPQGFLQSDVDLIPEI